MNCPELRNPQNSVIIFMDFQPRIVFRVLT